MDARPRHLRRHIGADRRPACHFIRRCPECDGRRTIADLSPDTGAWISLACPCCDGWGTVPDVDPDGDDWDPEPPTPAAPDLAVIVPIFRCMSCRDTGRVVKPSAYFRGRSIAGFCPDCTPHYDVARRGFVNCGAADMPGEAFPSVTPASALPAVRSGRPPAAFWPTLTAPSDPPRASDSSADCLLADHSLCSSGERRSANRVGPGCTCLARGSSLSEGLWRERTMASMMS